MRVASDALSPDFRTDVTRIKAVGNRGFRV